jgi:hypothetical protein
LGHKRNCRQEVKNGKACSVTSATYQDKPVQCLYRAEGFNCSIVCDRQNFSIGYIRAVQERAFKLRAK